MALEELNLGETELKAELAMLAAMPAADRAGAIFSGALLQRIVDYIIAHPEQAVALLKWLLALFGIEIPVPPIAPEPAGEATPE
jgi:hypothetical protein